MKRIRLVHWNEEEARVRAERLRSAGYELDSGPLDTAGLRQLRENPPRAVVIDLGRLPSQGRDLAVLLRRQKATRQVPLVFVGGEPKKVDGTRQLLPDAVYTSWSDVEQSLKHALAAPPADPVVPPTGMAGYSGTPLPKKLGIKADSMVALIDAPDDFEETLGTLPEGATLKRQCEGGRDLTLWFIMSQQQLEGQIKRMVPLAENGGLWIAWPKKASGVRSDLSEGVVREVAMAAGLVDFKVCAIDATWSGLRFSQKKR